MSLQSLLLEARRILPGEWRLAPSGVGELMLQRVSPADMQEPIGIALVVRAPSDIEAIERMRAMLAAVLVTLLNTRPDRPLEIFRAGGLLRPFGAFCDTGLVCPTANEGHCACLAQLHLIAADLLAAAENPSSDLGPTDT